jgi:hypothetical protein
VQFASDDIAKIEEAQAVIIEQQMIIEEQQRVQEQKQKDLHETFTE